MTDFRIKKTKMKYILFLIIGEINARDYNWKVNKVRDPNEN